jgi:hypothetical protein
MTPTLLINALDGLRLKVRRMSVLYGLGVVLAIGVASLSAVVALDYVLHLPGVPRLVLLLAIVAVLGTLAWRFVVRPLRSRLTLSDIAGKVEQVYPQFEDRLRSTVDFSRSNIPGSQRMQQLVVSEASSIAANVKLQDVVEVAPMWRAFGAGVVMLLVAVLSLSLMDGSLRGILLSRLFNPFSAEQWPRRVQIAMTADLPKRVPANANVDVRIKLTRGDRAGMKPIVLYQIGDGPVRREFMTRAPGSKNAGEFQLSLPARVESDSEVQQMKVCIEAGDDETAPKVIEILPRLMLKGAQLDAVTPAYVAPPRQSRFDLGKQQAAVLEGSTVTVTATFNKPLAKDSAVRLAPIGDSPLPSDVKYDRVSPSEVAIRFSATQSFRFRIEGTDEDGFTSDATGAEYELVVRPDQPPAVFIENPRRSEDRTAESTVPLVAIVEDDAGVSTAALSVKLLGQNPREWSIPLVETKDGNAVGTGGALFARAGEVGERTKFRVNFDWVLKQLPEYSVKPGDVLEYCVVVRDNFSLAGRVHDPVESGRLRITVISQEELTNRVIDELRQVKNQIADAKQRQDATNAQTDNFRQDTKDKRQLDEADATIGGKLQQQQSQTAGAARTAADRLEDIRRTLQENKGPATELDELAKDVEARLNRAAEGSMKDAAAQLGQASSKDPQNDPKKRDESLDAAQNNQRKASSELGGALDRMSDIGSLGQTIDALQKLLDEQRKVSEETRDIGKRNAGKTPEQMNKQDRDKLKELGDRQNELAEKTQRAIEQMNKQAGQMEKADPTGAEAMKKAAQQGQKQSVSQNQRSASQNVKQNQQSKARQNQQQAELGLEMMLSELREAEKRKLAELQRKLAELQELIATLIRRQSGHNLDNLTLQGADRLAKAGDEFLTKLREKTQRTPEQMNARPDAGRVVAGQIQTQRNTFDVSEKAAALPDGAEPASKLARASTQMERAIIQFRANKLAEAYEPPMVEALAALEEAKRLIDEQKQKADDEQDRQQREALRQRYIRIKTEQDRINGETTRIDAARGADGALKRVDSIALAKLAEDQAANKKEVDAAGEDLVALGSVVFNWASKQIGLQMDDVKPDLADLKSDRSVQTRQSRISKDLQRLIDNLKTKPKEQRFESQGGGGSGGGGPKMPPEAELRLLKGMQETINDETIETAKLPENGERDETARDVGRRQGQIRTLLNELMTNASQGQMKLPPEPADLKPLPEEANPEELDKQELVDDLMGGQAGGDKEQLDLSRIANRLSRARMRLADDADPGKATQTIQKRVLKDFDQLIELARQQQGKGGGQGQQNQPPPTQQEGQPNQNQAQNQGQNQQNQGSTAANSSTNSAPGGQANAGKPLDETAEEWGRISPRLRGPVLESRDDTIIERYRRLIEDYTQAVSTEASGKK